MFGQVTLSKSLIQNIASGDIKIVSTKVAPD